MKFDKRRSAVSQSLDLFIIIAAVLAIGGVVTASLYGLIGSASTSSNLQLTQYSLVGSAASSTSSGSLSSTLTFTVKNVGTTSASIASTAYFTMAINSETTATTTSCSGTPSSYTTAGTSVGWAAVASGGATACNAAGTMALVKWAGPSTAVTLAPGQQVAVSVVLTITTTSASISNPNTTGSTYALTVLIGSTALSQQMTSQ